MKNVNRCHSLNVLPFSNRCQDSLSIQATWSKKFRERKLFDIYMRVAKEILIVNAPCIEMHHEEMNFLYQSLPYMSKDLPSLFIPPQHNGEKINFLFVSEAILNVCNNSPHSSIFLNFIDLTAKNNCLEIGLYLSF